MLTHKFGQLPSALQGRRHPDCARPVVVAETLFVGQLGNCLQGKDGLGEGSSELGFLLVVEHQPVLAGVGAVLLDILGGQQEVDHVVPGHLTVDDRPCKGVLDHVRVKFLFLFHIFFSLFIFILRVLL